MEVGIDRVRGTSNTASCLKVQCDGTLQDRWNQPFAFAS
jgi:hypothetical protein